MLLVTPSGLRMGPSGRRRPPYFRTKKLAIIGCTQSIIHAPFFDESWTLAAHPAAKQQMPVAPDWWFDLHGPQNFRKGKHWAPHYYKWLQNLTEPIFMQKDWHDVPMAVRFPKERILAEFRPYFTNHVAWMIALAITEGVTHLGLFGCDYKIELERGKQRGSAEYWLGFFEGHGGHVVMSPGHSLLTEPRELYGYESHDEHGKLILSYRLSKPKAETSKTPTLPNGLTILDNKHAEGRPPLMDIGEAPAWERSGHLVHA